MSDTNRAITDDPLARQLARLAPEVDLVASRAAFGAARAAGRPPGDRPQWWLAAVAGVLVVTGIVGVWAIRGEDATDAPDLPAADTGRPVDDTATGPTSATSATSPVSGATVALPDVGAPTLHNTSAGMVWVVAHADGTVSVLPATLEGNAASEDGAVTNLRSLVRASASGRTFSDGARHWDDHGRALTSDRADDLVGYAGRIVGDEVEILSSPATRVTGEPDADVDVGGEVYPDPPLGEPIDVMTFTTLSSSGPVWRYLDAALVVEDGIGRICDAAVDAAVDVPVDVPVDEMSGCGAEVALDTRIRSNAPEITTWFHPPVLALQSPEWGFTHVIPLGGFSIRNDEIIAEPPPTPPRAEGVDGPDGPEGFDHVLDPVPGSEWTVTTPSGDDSVLEISFLGQQPFTDGGLCSARYTATAEETADTVTIHLSADILTRYGNAIVSCVVGTSPLTVVVELDSPLGDRRLMSGDGAELTIGGDGVLASPPADPVARLAIGDSVMLGAAEELTSRGYTVDAVVSRQLGDIVAPVRALVREGALVDSSVVIHLGNNGPIDQADLDALLDALADVEHVVLLTSHAERAWIDPNNDLIQDAERRPDVVVLDWASTAERCGDGCFQTDDLHLTVKGAEFYADAIDQVTIGDGSLS